MAMEPKEPEATANSSAASGSGATAAERSADISAQNAKAVDDGIIASLKRRSEDSGDDVERVPRGSTSPRGQKRDAEDDANDEERMSRDASVQRAVERLQKRKDADQDDTARTEDRADDMSSLAQHPGPVHFGGRIDRADL